jgi:glycosyltransferase involved in cell wall biosynthesis
LKLSIITINLNNASGLLKTIESVISQTSHDFEYIIIDGGSNDGSVEFIKSYTSIPPGIYKAKDKVEENINAETFASSPIYTTTQITLCSLALSPVPITYWVSEPDSGIYNAMNKGIRIAKGKYCQFLNSGDWLANSTITEQMLASIPNCSVYYGNMIKLMLDGRVLRNKEIPVNSFLTFFTGTLNHSSAYIKRSLFSKYGMYDEDLKIVSDWKFFLISIALNSEKVCYRDLDVTYFDMKGISNVEKELNVNERERVLKETIPITILSDYEKYWGYIVKMKRLNRFWITRWFVWFVERILFKLEKIETRNRKEHIFY